MHLIVLLQNNLLTGKNVLFSASVYKKKITNKLKLSE